MAQHLQMRCQRGRETGVNYVVESDTAPATTANGPESRQIRGFLPIIMLAIIFGLSSDYEVFVVSRIKEEYTTNGDARRAVQRGTGCRRASSPPRR